MTRSERNERIRQAKVRGVTTGELAQQFCLSKEHVRLIARGGRLQRSVYDPLSARMNHLPFAIESTRRKLAALEDEARRYGMTDLVENRA